MEALKQTTDLEMAMIRTITILLATMVALGVYADTYRYSFNSQPLAKALSRIADEHPDVEVNFIYNELENYKTSASVNTTDLYEALRRVVGLNPVTIVKKGDVYFIEALQHGRYIYTGRAVGADNEPVIAATVLLLAPKDSTVITYGITDDAGRFSIPCDRKGVIAKITSVGYRPTYRNATDAAMGTIRMEEASTQLQALNVEGAYATLYSDRSVYIPTKNQKRSSISATDLIERMALPQLRIGNKTETLSGQEVKLYIDFQPATESELTGMNVDDVKRVEYYDNPADPRFQNNPHVINFIMQKYVYGGYVKGTYHDSFVSSRGLNGYAKFQYKKMTYDWAGSGYNNDSKNKDYSELFETYRLPQADCTVREFERNSLIDSSHIREWKGWTSLKAQYRSDETAISNMLTFTHDRTPENRTDGRVEYSPEVYPSSAYTDSKSSRVNSVIYGGYWYFQLPHGNTLTFNPSYAFTRTRQSSLYSEADMGSYENRALDNSHQAKGDLAFTHTFGSAGTLNASCSANYLENNTAYSGTSTVSDKARTIRIGPGVSYSLTNEKFYGSMGVGLHWDRSSYGDIKERSLAPNANMAIQYSFDRKNSVYADVKYSKSVPSSSFRSAAVVQSNPFMRYTGNPALVPYNSIIMNSSYTFVPSNRYSFSVYGFGWIVDHRYVYDFEADGNGILRTIKQPMGSYGQWQYGAQATTRQLDNNLQVSASVHLDNVHNGAPYNWTKSKIGASLRAYYYVMDFYFGASCSSSQGYADGCMVGDWVTTRPYYTLQAGWNHRNWKVNVYTINLLTHDYASKFTMDSEHYDTRRYQYSANYSNFIRVTATYTFSFGKKVKSGEDAYQASGASSGILK